MLGMSGGVDSSVAAAILLEKGFEVIGVTMQIWPDMDEDRRKLKAAAVRCPQWMMPEGLRIGLEYLIML